MKILIAIIIFEVINLLFLSCYCYCASKLEGFRESKKNAEHAISHKVTSQSKNRKCINILKEIYRYLDPYFYGWMHCNIILTGKIPSNRIRKVLYKYIFHVKLKKKTVISHGCEIRAPWNVKLGNCIIAADCILDGRSGIEIQDNVVLGGNVHIWTWEHDFNDAYFAVTEAHKGKVVIKSRAWVCSDSTILPSIVINEGAVVASRACVTKDCEEYCVYGGVPAKKISERNRDLRYELSGRPHWHFN